MKCGPSIREVCVKVLKWLSNLQKKEFVILFYQSHCFRPIECEKAPRFQKPIMVASMSSKSWQNKLDLTIFSTFMASQLKNITLTLGALALGLVMVLNPGFLGWKALLHSAMVRSTCILPRLIKWASGTSGDFGLKVNCFHIVIQQHWSSWTAPMKGVIKFKKRQFKKRLHVFRMAASVCNFSYF